MRTKWLLIALPLGILLVLFQSAFWVPTYASQAEGNPGRLVSQRQLLQEVWGPTYVEQAHYLRQYVKALRHKLEDDPTRPRHLITEAGMGYRFQP